MNSQVPYAAIILAAGNSSRLGSPKQLLKYNGTNLLTNLIQEVKQVNFSQITVVLGAYSDQILSEIPVQNIHIVQNTHWNQGIGTSIHAGIQSLNTETYLKGCVFMVCDQPYLTNQLLNDLITNHQSGPKGIVAALYDGIAGTPAVFSSTYFSELAELPPEEGAKTILKKHKDDTLYVHFEDGKYDIDTLSDYLQLPQ